LRSGKYLAETVNEVVVQLKPPPQKLFEDSPTTIRRANYLRFQLSPHSTIGLAARVKRKGKKFVGDQEELSVIDEQCGERLPYERLLEDAMSGDRSLFTRQDAVEAAWAIVDPVIQNHPRALPYQRGSWGPKEADALIAKAGSWHNPSLDGQQSGEAEQRTPPKIKDILGTD
jgi:glucose-6-phosphate 1-dehydrogenase